ncbi:hypothetical protein ABEB36_003455 [Hypothenemus hampei]|uniref:Uncharacterized protein n=1 Tax=Hypothenemus hampei TaxID=57062 RepID=A0ABD1F970_HYPHA
MNINQEQFRNSSSLLWWRYFNWNRARYRELDEVNIKIKVYKGSRCFTLSFSTNGVDVSVMMNRFSGEQDDDNEISLSFCKRGRLKKKLAPSSSSSSNFNANNNYEYYLGLGPGVVNYVEACLRHEPSGKEIKSIVKSEHFKQSLCKERIRTKTHKRKIGEFETMLKTDRVNIETALNLQLNARISHNCRDNLKYIRYRLQYFV